MFRSRERTNGSFGAIKHPSHLNQSIRLSHPFKISVRFFLSFGPQRFFNQVQPWLVGLITPVEVIRNVFLQMRSNGSYNSSLLVERQ